MVSELSPAEQRLLDGVRLGELVDFGGDLDPSTSSGWGPDRTIRAEVLNELALGKRDDWHVHHHGVRLRGALITGRLDLSLATVPCALSLQNCRFEDLLIAIEAKIRTLSLSGSFVPGILGEGLVTEGGLSLNNGFRAKGPIKLTGAKIGGTLDFNGGSLSNNQGPALDADEISIGRNLFLGRGLNVEGEARLIGAFVGSQLDASGGSFSNPEGDALCADGINVSSDVLLDEIRAVGEVRLLGAQIGAQLRCSGATFTNPDRDALSMDGVVTKGNVYLDDGFSATGAVRLEGTQIGGDLRCANGSFRNLGGKALDAEGLTARSVLLESGFEAVGEVRFVGAELSGSFDCFDAAFGNSRGQALSAEGMIVTRRFRWQLLRGTPEGAVNLSYANVGQLADDPASWPSEGNLRITGFVYRGFAEDAPTASADRLKWLSLMPAFAAQPYEQLIRVFRESGQDAEARAISIARQEALRTKGSLENLSKVWNWVLGRAIGHGYKPQRAVVPMIALIVLGSLVFAEAKRDGVMMPTKAAPSPGTQTSTGSGQAATEDSYPRLQPLVYSVDVLLPIVDLHQEDYWIPDSTNPSGRIYLKYLWGSIIAGWILTTILVASFTGLLWKD